MFDSRRKQLAELEQAAKALFFKEQGTEYDKDFPQVLILYTQLFKTKYPLIKLPLVEGGPDEQPFWIMTQLENLVIFEQMFELERAEAEAIKQQREQVFDSQLKTLMDFVQTGV